MFFVRTYRRDYGSPDDRLIWSISCGRMSSSASGSERTSTIPLVAALANWDGEAHLDRELPRALRSALAEQSLGWNARLSAVGSPVPANVR